MVLQNVYFPSGEDYKIGVIPLEPAIICQEGQHIGEDNAGSLLSSGQK